MQKHRVLIVEDEQDIAGLIKHTLERAAKPKPKSSAAAMPRSRPSPSEPPDLIILDLNLPVLERARGLPPPALSGRDARHLPIIMLTARSSESDRVGRARTRRRRLRHQAVQPARATARVQAVLRRTTALRSGRRSATWQHLIADFDAVAVAVDGQPVRLTRREFELLRYLVQNKNRVVSRDRLLERVWGYDRMVETRSVDVHVGRLRRSSGRQAGRSKRRSGSAIGSSTERLDGPAVGEQFRDFVLHPARASARPDARRSALKRFTPLDSRPLSSTLTSHLAAPASTME